MCGIDEQALYQRAAQASEDDEQLGLQRRRCPALQRQQAPAGQQQQREQRQSAEPAGLDEHVQVEIMRFEAKFLVAASGTDAERIRAELMHGLIARALELSLRRLYAVADGREDLFRSFGFEVVEAERVPSALRRRAAEVFAARPEGGAASPVLMERPLA